MGAIGESPRDPAPGVEPGGHEQSSIVPEGPKSTAELAEAPPSGSKVVPPAPQFEPLTAPPAPSERGLPPWAFPAGYLHPPNPIPVVSAEAPARRTGDNPCTPCSAPSG